MKTTELLAMTRNEVIRIRHDAWRELWESGSMPL
jgi:hypothetical protein